MSTMHYNIYVHICHVCIMIYMSQVNWKKVEAEVKYLYINILYIDIYIIPIYNTYIYIYIIYI